MIQHLAEFTNREDGVTSFVVKGERGYNVILRDDDSGEHVGVVLIFPTLEAAATKAQEIVAGADELREELEALRDCYSDMIGQYRAECALYGDAGPGQGTDCARVYARIRQIEKQLADRFGGPNYDRNSTPDGV